MARLQERMAQIVKEANEKHEEKLKALGAQREGIKRYMQEIQTV